MHVTHKQYPLSSVSRGTSPFLFHPSDDVVTWRGLYQRLPGLPRLLWRLTEPFPMKSSFDMCIQGVRIIYGRACNIRRCIKSQTTLFVCLRNVPMMDERVFVRLRCLRNELYGIRLVIDAISCILQSSHSHILYREG